MSDDFYDKIRHHIFRMFCVPRSILESSSLPQAKETTMNSTICQVCKQFTPADELDDNGRCVHCRMSKEEAAAQAPRLPAETCGDPGEIPSALSEEEHSKLQGLIAKTFSGSAPGAYRMLPISKPEYSILEAQRDQDALDFKAGIRTRNEWRSVRMLPDIPGNKGEEIIMESAPTVILEVRDFMGPEQIEHLCNMLEKASEHKGTGLKFVVLPPGVKAVTTEPIYLRLSPAPGKAAQMEIGFRTTEEFEKFIHGPAYHKTLEVMMQTGLFAGDSPITAQRPATMSAEKRMEQETAKLPFPLANLGAPPIGRGAMFISGVCDACGKTFKAVNPGSHQCPDCNKPLRIVR